MTGAPDAIRTRIIDYAIGLARRQRQSRQSLEALRSSRTHRKVRTPALSLLSQSVSAYAAAADETLEALDDVIDERKTSYPADDPGTGTRTCATHCPRKLGDGAHTALAAVPPADLTSRMDRQRAGEVCLSMAFPATILIPPNEWP
jgi:hypothetical protein